MIKKITAFLFFLICSGIYLAGANYYLISDIGVSAKSIALGGIGSFSNSAEVLFFNPAGLASVSNNSLSLFQTSIMREVNYQNFSYAQKTPLGTFGIGYMNANVGSIPYTELNASYETVITSYYDYNNYIYKLGYAYNLTDNLAVGASLTGYRFFLYNVNGAGFGLDFGGLYTLDNLALSLTAFQVLNSKVIYSNGQSEDLLHNYSFAAKYKIWDCDFLGQVNVKEYKNLLSAAVSYQPSFLQILEVNLGYKQSLVLDKVRSSGVLGLGLVFEKLGFYYAYEKSDHYELSDNNYFSVTINF